MDYKEYALENKQNVRFEDLVVGHIPKEDYLNMHKNTIIVCADIMIWYEGGFLLVKRDNVPALGEMWPIGGRMQRGIPLEKNMKIKAKAECGLGLENLCLLNVGRTIFNTDPFGHGKGTDTVNFMYCAEGTGKLNLDTLHSKPTIIGLEFYKKIKSILHPYVVDFMNLAFEHRGIKF